MDVKGWFPVRTKMADTTGMGHSTGAEGKLLSGHATLAGRQSVGVIKRSRDGRSFEGQPVGGVSRIAGQPRLRALEGSAVS